MARPRVLKTSDGGEIVLKNCSSDVYEKVRSLLSGATTSTVETPETAEDESMPHVALGTFKNGTWQLAEIEFNDVTKNARVRSITDYNDRLNVKEAFKIVAVKLGLV